MTEDKDRGEEFMERLQALLNEYRVIMCPDAGDHIYIDFADTGVQIAVIDAFDPLAPDDGGDYGF